MRTECVTGMSWRKKTNCKNKNRACAGGRSRRAVRRTAGRVYLFVHFVFFFFFTFVRGVKNTCDAKRVLYYRLLLCARRRQTNDKWRGGQRGETPDVRYRLCRVSCPERFNPFSLFRPGPPFPPSTLVPPTHVVSAGARAPHTGATSRPCSHRVLP